MTTSTTTQKSPRDLFDEAIKTEWPHMFREGGEALVYKSNGSRYVPVARNNPVLRDDVNAWDEAIRAWTNHSDSDSTTGFDQIIADAGAEFTWEGVLIDPARPWAKELRRDHPEVVTNIEADLKKRGAVITAHRAAEAAEAQRLELEADETMILAMDVRRIAKGQDPLTEDQKQLVRSQRLQRRS